MHPTADLRAWEALPWPVNRDGTRDHLFTLELLGTHDGCERLQSWLDEPGLTRLARILAPVHHASWALTEVLIRPLLFDAVWISARPDQLGFLAEPQDDSALWLSPDAEVLSCPPPESVGDAVADLLAPICAAVAQRSPLRESVVKTIAAESLIAGMHRAERSAALPEPTEWMTAVSAAVAQRLEANTIDRRLECAPDAGAPVVFPDRRYCCVLSDAVRPSCCPGCPRVGGQSDRHHHVTTWLRSLGDEEFLDTCGRPREDLRPDG